MTVALGQPDLEGFLWTPEPGAGRWDGRFARVRVWHARAEPVEPEVWGGYLQIEGHAGYEAPRLCPGGDPFQATTLTYAHLLAVAKRVDGLLRATDHWP